MEPKRACEDDETERGGQINAAQYSSRGCSAARLGREKESNARPSHAQWSLARQSQSSYSFPLPTFYPVLGTSAAEGGRELTKVLTISAIGAMSLSPLLFHSMLLVTATLYAHLTVSLSRTTSSGSRPL